MNDKNTFRTIDETIHPQFESGWAAGNLQPIESLVGEPTSENYLATLNDGSKATQTSTVGKKSAAKPGRPTPKLDANWTMSAFGN